MFAIPLILLIFSILSFILTEQFLKNRTFKINDMKEYTGFPKYIIAIIFFYLVIAYVILS